MCHIVKFLRRWGRMIAPKKIKELSKARQQLEEVNIFLEEDLHNVTLQEEATKLEMVVHRGKDYINRVLRPLHVFSGFRREVKTPSSILTSLSGRWLPIGCLVSVGMMALLLRTLLRSEHFQNIFAPYVLTCSHKWGGGC